MTFDQWFRLYPPSEWTVGYYDGFNGHEYNPKHMTNRCQYALGYDEGRLNDVSYVDLLLGRKRR